MQYRSTSQTTSSKMSKCQKLIYSTIPQRDQEMSFFGNCAGFNVVINSIYLYFAAHQSLPESDPRKMEEMRKRNTLVMLALKEAAENKDNIARN